MKKHLIYIAAILFMGGGLSLSAQTADTTVRASIDSSTAYVGQPVRYSIKISSAKKTERPLLQNFKGFRIQEAGESTSVRAFSQNGRTTKAVISEFTWLLFPESTGKLSIPSVSLTVEGEQFRTAEGILNVLEPAPLEGYHLFLQADGADVFPGLPVRISLKWLFSSQVSQPDFSLPFLNQPDLKVTTLPAPSGQISDIYQLSIGGQTVYATQSAEIYKGEQYASLTIEWDAYPQKTGTIELDPVTLSFKRGVSRDSWGNIDYENAVIPSNSLTLQVMDLPGSLKNAPGGLLITRDKLGVEVKLDQQRVYPGDPINITMKLTNLMQPSMTEFRGFQDFPELQDQFRTDEDSLISYQEEDSLIIKQTVRVSNPDTGDFPALTFKYYNQKTGKTEEIRSEAAPLEIIPIEADGRIPASPLLKSGTSAKSDQSSAKLSLFHNETMENIREPFFRSVPIAAYLLTPPILYLLIVVVLYFKSGKSSRFFLSLLQREDSYTRLKGEIRGIKKNCSSHRIRNFSEFLREWIRKEYGLEKTSGSPGLSMDLQNRGMDQIRAEKIRLLFDRLDQYCWSDTETSEGESLMELRDFLADIKPEDFYTQSGRKSS